MVARFGHVAGLRDFLTLLASVRGDLSSITAPPFILAPQSLVEFPSYWAERPRLFAAPALEPDAACRALCVLKLYLTSLQRQYYVGRTAKEGLKKPLNPFLGEIYLGEWADEVSGAKTSIISEQVSHHPPTTACFVEDELNGVSVGLAISNKCVELIANHDPQATAYSTQSTTLSGASVLIKQSGHALLTVEKYDENFLIPLPDVRVRGILTGVPYPELDGTYKIISSSGFVAEMHFSGGKMWSGTRNLFEASVYRSDDEDQKPIFELSGSWSDRFTVHDTAGTEIEAVDLSDAKYQPVSVSLPAVAEQNPWESRRAWGATVDALRRGDTAGVVAEKSRLENAQRCLRKREHTAGQSWETSFFLREDGDVDEDEDVFKDLVGKGKMDKAEIERLRGSNGKWRFDGGRAKSWTRSDDRRSGLTPFG